MLKNKHYQVKVLPNRSHLNCHTIGFHRQTQKFESPNKTPPFPLGAKGLRFLFALLNDNMNGIM